MILYLEFTHRSVLEFFAKESVFQHIQNQTRGLDLVNSACELTFAEIRCSGHFAHHPHDAAQTLSQLYDGLLVQNCGTLQFASLSALDRTLENFRTSARLNGCQTLGHFDIYDFRPSPGGMPEGVRSCALLNGYSTISSDEPELFSTIYIFALKGSLCM